jgi:hypothetical protein
MTCDIFLIARSALNEKSLERYLESLLGDQKRLSMLYDDWAFLRYILPGIVVDPGDPVGSETFNRIRIRIRLRKKHSLCGQIQIRNERKVKLLRETDKI